MSFIDGHTHSHLRSYQELEQMALAGIDGVVVCAFLPVRPSHFSTLGDLFRWLMGPETARLAELGIAARVAVGIHPRCIPEEGVDQALAIVEKLLTERHAAALGEVGLETGSDEEKDVLARQLRVARKTNSPIVLHTPRGRKAELLDESLRILQDERVDMARVILDHLTPELLGKARQTGAFAGLTVQPGKLTPEDVARAILTEGAANLIVNSDLSHVASDPLTLARVGHHLRRVGIDGSAIAQATHDNIAKLMFF